MATTTRLRNTSPKAAGPHLGHRFLARFAVASSVTALVLLLSIVSTTDPLPSWTRLIGLIAGASLLLGVLAGLFGERFVDWWLRVIRSLSP